MHNKVMSPSDGDTDEDEEKRRKKKLKTIILGYLISNIFQFFFKDLKSSKTMVFNNIFSRLRTRVDRMTILKIENELKLKNFIEKKK